MSQACGPVYLVGGGPGDPGLITVRGRHLLERADVVVHDRLIDAELPAYARCDAEIIDVGKRPGQPRRTQEQISALLVDRARAGCTVVRLKGGDPFVFGRGWEEWRACCSAGVPCYVIPGVTSAIAAPAMMGVPVTLRDTSRSLAIITAHTSDSRDAAELDYAALARMDTVVVMMGRSNLAEVAERLIRAGREPTTPAACIEHGTTGWQRSVVATLATIAKAADREALGTPAITVIGQVANCAEEYRQRLHAASTNQRSEPLAGKRVVITRSSASQHALSELLLAAGAVPIKVPVIHVTYAAKGGPLDAAIGRLEQYDWITFPSVHAVAGFFERLSSLGGDARALASCKVAAIGPITAGALGKRGIRPDLVPEPYSAAALVQVMLATSANRLGQILCPHGEDAGAELPGLLRRAGAQVEEVITHRADAVPPPPAARRALAAGVDAVLFSSPMAARQFATLGLNPAGATVACMGPATAAAARQAGLDVTVVADQLSDESVVAALATHFNSRVG